MENTNNLGERIKQVRERLELSQKAFGARIGMSQTAVTALENNQNEPRLSTFNQIVEVYKINPEWLRTGQGQMPKAQPEEAVVLDSGEATVEYANKLASTGWMQQVIDGQAKLIEAKDKVISLLEEELKKFGGSSDAADSGLGPLLPLLRGQRLAYQGR